MLAVWSCRAQEVVIAWEWVQCELKLIIEYQHWIGRKLCRQQLEEGQGVIQTPEWAKQNQEQHLSPVWKWKHRNKGHSMKVGDKIDSDNCHQDLPFLFPIEVSFGKTHFNKNITSLHICSYVRLMRRENLYFQTCCLLLPSLSNHTLC